MNKLIKTIKLHRKLRVKQEKLCNQVVKNSQDIRRHDNIFRLYCYKISDELGSLNKAVANIESKLPWLYFVLSDIFGGASSIKKLANKTTEDE